MKSPTPYQEHANRCRELAEIARSAEDRDILLKIADTWDWIGRDYDQSDSASGTVDRMLAQAAK